MGNSTLATYTNITSHHGNGRGGNKISRIIIHHAAGVWKTCKNGCDYFRNTDRSVGATYCIGVDGSIGCSTNECDRPYTSGSSKADNPAITIEVSNDNTKTWTVSDASLKALINLCADCCKRNGITKLEKGKNLYGHRDWDATICPGNYLYGKLDYIATEVNKILTTPTITSTASNNVYVVQCGAFGTKAAAENYAKTLKTKYGLDTIVKLKYDENGDGKITAADAQIVLNKATGK